LRRPAEKKKPKKKSKKAAVKQTEPPTVPVSRFFKDGTYPVGELHDYVGKCVARSPSLVSEFMGTALTRSSRNSNSWRTTSEEMRHKDRLMLDEPSDSAFNYNAVRRAAEVHRQVRQYARTHIQPGMGMTEIADMIENGTRALVEENGMQAGIGFPTGLSRNHCAAHYTPNAGDTIGASSSPSLCVWVVEQRV